MLTFDATVLAQGDFRLSVDLSVSQGVTAVIGPSGAGKSTLLAAVAGFLEPRAGDILWNDASVIGLPPGRRPVSMLFQDHNLFPHLTIGQNVGLGVRPDMRLDAQQRQVVEAALTEVGLQGFSDRKPGTLSGGQQSRAALARVLVVDRPLVLLDEPFAALGPAMKAEMLQLVRQTLADAGKTVLMVTHDPTDAKAVADHVVMVADARADAPFPTEAIFADPPAALAAYLGQE